MQNNNLPLISISRENYEVPKGEEQLVHYKIEKVRFSNDGRVRISHPDLIKTSDKMFDMVKRNLELQGYMVEILFHPEGKYTDVRIPKDTASELAEKEDEIAKLKAELEVLKATKEVEEVPEVKKVGRPKKSE